MIAHCVLKTWGVRVDFMEILHYKRVGKYRHDKNIQQGKFDGIIT